MAIADAILVLRTQSHARTTHARTHARTHACTHARMHAHTHARTHARTHTHFEFELQLRQNSGEGGWANLAQLQHQLIHLLCYLTVRLLPHQEHTHKGLQGRAGQGGYTAAQVTPHNSKVSIRILYVQELKSSQTFSPVECTAPGLLLSS